MRTAYLRYLKRHPLAANVPLQAVIEHALTLAQNIMNLTAAEFPRPDDPRTVAQQMGIKVELVATRPSFLDDNLPARQYAFVAESAFDEKNIRVNIFVLEKMATALQAKSPAQSLDIAMLEQIALAHELFHFLLERYLSKFPSQSREGRVAALTEEIAAHEFARASLRLENFADILDLLTAHNL
jgi:hypothetical protein